MLAWGVVIGVVLAFAAARLTVPRLDPIGTIPPDPILVTPILSFAIAAAIVGALAWLGAAWTVRRARSVDVAEVMRVAE
jgi:ABC-type antimicrobial peptide transport system permease subunit